MRVRVRALSRTPGGSQRMTRGLTKGSLAAIREETCLTRWGWGGRLETLAYANRRSLLDIAQASVMRDRLSGGGRGGGHLVGRDVGARRVRTPAGEAIED